MIRPKRLYLYEEVLLLALRNEKGTIASGFAEYAVAGAVLAELLLEGRIAVEDAKKQLVTLRNLQPIDDPIVDECMRRMAAGRKRASLKTWLGRLAGIKDLRHKVARRLCDRGILRADEDKVLLLFTRRVYPEINPAPEREIVERVRAAVFTDEPRLEPRTVVLISLAHGADLLGENFGRRTVRSRKKRIEQIVNGELTGKATKEVIAACQAAVTVAVMVPVIVAATSN